MVFIDALVKIAAPISKSNRVEDYKYLPLEGLLSLNKNQFSNADIFSVINEAEKIINSSPKGRVSHLALLFYLINILENAGLEFYVKGGVIQHYYLKDKARATNDLDIIIKEDSDVFYQKLIHALSKINNGLAFKVAHYSHYPADKKYYYDIFNIELVVLYQDKEWMNLTIDGISNSFIYNNIQPLTYQIPEVIAPHSFFKGTPIAYVLAEKIIAITNELARPCKHLVDVYSLIHTHIDIPLLKNYLALIIDNDNRVRKNLGIDIQPYSYQIKDHKTFVSSYIFSALQAGYTLTFDEMKNEVNAWMKTNLA